MHYLLHHWLHCLLHVFTFKLHAYYITNYKKQLCFITCYYISNYIQRYMDWTIVLHANYNQYYICQYMTNYMAHYMQLQYFYITGNDSMNITSMITRLHDYYISCYILNYMCCTSPTTWCYTTLCMWLHVFSFNCMIISWLFTWFMITHIITCHFTSY